LHISTNLTLEAWIKPSASPPDHRHIVGKNKYELAVAPDSGAYHAVFDFFTVYPESAWTW
jgi:hypothetical protein